MAVWSVDALAIDTLLIILTLEVTLAIDRFVGAFPIGDDLGTGTLGETCISMGNAVIATHQVDDVGTITAFVGAATVDAALVIFTVSIGSTCVTAALARLLRTPFGDNGLFARTGLPTNLLGWGTLVDAVFFVFAVRTIGVVITDPIGREALARVTQEGIIDAGLTIKLVTFVSAIGLAVAGNPVFYTGVVVALKGPVGATFGGRTSAVSTTACAVVALSAVSAASVGSTLAVTALRHAHRFTLAIDTALAIGAFVVVATAVGGTVVFVLTV